MADIRKHIVSFVSGDGLRARLVRGGIGSAAIQAANRVISLMLGITLARSLGAEGYGIYTYAFAVMNLLMVVAEAGVPTLLMREVASCCVSEQWGRLRGGLIRSGQFVLFVSGTIAAVCFLVLCLTANKPGSATFITNALMLLVLPLAVLTKTVTHAIQGLHRVVTALAVEQLLRPLVVLLIAGGLFFFYPDLRVPQYAMAAQVAAVLIALVTGMLVLKGSLPKELHRNEAEYHNRQWVKSAFSFALISGTGLINTQADIIMLGLFGSSVDVGFYRVAMNGATLIGFGFHAINAIVAPEFVSFFNQKKRTKLQRIVTASARASVLTALPGVFVFIVFGKEIVSFVFGIEYVRSYLSLAILSTGKLFYIAMGPVGFLVMMTGHEHQTVYFMLATSILNIILNIILIPIYGSSGAAISTSISNFLLVIMLYLLIRNKLRINTTVFFSGKRKNI